MILFATETGTSEAYAHRLHSLLERRGLDLPVAALDESAPLSDLELVVFVVSTTGDGQLPSSSLRAWTALRQASLPPMLLASLRFAIFGFGDSAYEHFNAAARKLRARLVQLGAKELCNAGAADDQGEPETLFNAWFIKHLLPGLSIDPGLPPSPVALPTRLYSVTAAPLVRSAPLPVLATVRANRRLTHADWPQDVRHIEFDAALQFSAGDVLYLTPSNVPAGGEVLQRFVRTKLADAADVPVVFSPAHAFIPDGVTPREACEEWLDVMGTPRAGFFECASFFCTDAEERERMLELAEGVGYSDYCRRELRSHAQVLLDFASCAIPFVWLAQLIGPIRPRAFSIASSPRFHAGAVHLTVAVVRHLTPNKRWRSGLCSTWLAALRPGDALRRVSVKPGALALPSDPGAPLILIGPGTGMAPMRSLLYDRIALGAPGPTHLYLGFRSKHADNLYGDEMAKVPNVRWAFSRDAPKAYVQVRLKEDGAALARLVLEAGAYVYVAGNAKRMPADVRETFVQVLMQHAAMERAQAEQALKRMDRERRWVVEVY